MSSKVALVTAASRGIGRASAEALARDGFSLSICSRTKRTIEGAAKSIREISGQKVLPLVTDVSQRADLKRVVQTTLKQFGRIDVLVNNCGGPPPGGIEALTDDQWLAGFEETVLSIVRLCRLVLPIMKQQRGGRIINISSITAHESVPPLLISCTLRPGLSGFTRYLARELAKDNILINNILPGWTDTDRVRELLRDPRKKKRISQELPMRRMGRPEEIGNVVAFLASPAASYLTGCDIPVDGALLKGI